MVRRGSDSVESGPNSKGLNEPRESVGIAFRTRIARAEEFKPARLMSCSCHGQL